MFFTIFLILSQPAFNGSVIFIEGSALVYVSLACNVIILCVSGTAAVVSVATTCGHGNEG